MKEINRNLKINQINLQKNNLNIQMKQKIGFKMNANLIIMPKINLNERKIDSESDSDRIITNIRQQNNRLISFKEYSLQKDFP